MRDRSTRTAGVLGTALMCLVAALVLTPPAAARGAIVPQIGSVEVGGQGPGDLIRAVGTGFEARSAVSITLVGSATTVDLVATVADAGGTVSVPAATRVPATATPGIYRLGMSGPDGATAVSRFFTLVHPQVQMLTSLTPGAPGSPTLPAARIRLSGLANSPDVVRTVTIDGVEVPIRWYSDQNAFLNPDLGVAVPATLGVGDHTVVFTQTGATPFTASARIPVLAPQVVVPNPVAPRSRVWINVDRGGWQDEWAVRIEGSAHDVHTGTVFGSGAGTGGSVDVDRLSVGPATVTVTSRHNGATAGASFVVDGSSVSAPGGLQPGGRLVTADGSIEFDLEADGNLTYGFVGYAPTWSTRTAGHPGARLVVQSDGNVVLRAVNGTALWTTGTQGIGAGARLALDSHHEVAVFTASGRQAYSTFLAGGSQLLPSLTVGQQLFKTQALSSNLTGTLRGAAYFTMQDDGNLVLRTSDYGVRWSSRTQGHPNAYLVLQSDGNLVLRGPDGRALWANGARGTGTRLVAQTDGNIVEYASNGKALWSTRTAMH